MGRILGLAGTDQGAKDFANPTTLARGNFHADVTSNQDATAILRDKKGNDRSTAIHRRRDRLCFWGEFGTELHLMFQVKAINSERDNPNEQEQHGDEESPGNHRDCSRSGRMSVMAAVMEVMIGCWYDGSPSESALQLSGVNSIAIAGRAKLLRGCKGADKDSSSISRLFSCFDTAAAIALLSFRNAACAVSQGRNAVRGAGESIAVNKWTPDPLEVAWMERINAGRAALAAMAR